MGCDIQQDEASPSVDHSQDVASDLLNGPDLVPACTSRARDHIITIQYHITTPIYPILRIPSILDQSMHAQVSNQRHRSVDLGYIPWNLARSIIACKQTSWSQQESLAATKKRNRTITDCCSSAQRRSDENFNLSFSLKDGDTSSGMSK